MANLIRRSLLLKLVLFFLLVALIPTVVVGYLSFKRAKAGLESSVLAELETARKQAVQSVAEYLLASMTDLKFLADTWSVQAAFEILSFYDEGAETSQHEHTIELGSAEYNKVVEEIAPLFKKWLKLYQEDNSYQDLLIVVGQKRGRVVYTQKGLSDLGTDLTSGSLKGTPLAGLWEKVAKTRKPAIADFSHYPPIDGPAAFLGVPVIAEGKFCGVLVLRIGPEKIDGLMATAGSRGTTGDAFVVGQDFLMRSNALLAKNTILKEKVETVASVDALQGKEGTGIRKDYRGVEVLDSWAPVGLKTHEALGADFDWSVIVKMDSQEAFESVTSLAYQVILIAIVIGVAVAVTAFFLARAVAKPITLVAAEAIRVSQGDLTVEVMESKRVDELGALTGAFREMVNTLRKQIAGVQEGISVLTSSATEISTTVSQVAESATKTSAAVMETTTTVEQVKQAAKVSSEKAKDVSQTSNQAVQISDSGKRATEETVQRMKLIKEQMESIGETVVRLSEHSKAIEEIIAVVQDLADQSNLLAVNASIEAARAGEQGKGFAVVAHEIKSLADQSKEATAQVRSILDDTRKWVSAVVMATEQGSKAVEAGVQQSVLAGESIQSLADSVLDSSQAASVIDASTAQQFSGVEQVATAMTNIEKAMQQNLVGTKQLESSAKNLEQVGTSLGELATYYRV